jgi:hypothetical protein
MDEGQQASVTAGCTATFKLRARPILMKYEGLSDGWKIAGEAMNPKSLLLRRQAA